MGQVSAVNLSPVLLGGPGGRCRSGRFGRGPAGGVAETGCAKSSRIPYQRPGDLPISQVSAANLSPALRPSGWAAAEGRSGLF